MKPLLSDKIGCTLKGKGVGDREYVMYLITDRSTLAVLAEFPATIEGYSRAVHTASIFAQWTELYPSGVILKKQNDDDNTIIEVVTITKGRP